MNFNKLLGLTFICLNLFFGVKSFSQESHQDTHQETEIKVEHHEDSHEESHHKKHAISIAISHTHIRAGKDNEEGNEWVAAPSFGINYNYSLGKKWHIGLHNDIIIEEVAINSFRPRSSSSESEPDKEYDRARPISSSIMLTYKAFKNVAFVAGGGMEFSKHKDFGVVRIGVETPFHLPNNWEIFSALTYDFNIDSFNSVTFGVGLAKLF